MIQEPLRMRAILVSSFTQAGKTWKCLHVLAQSMTYTSTMVLFVTQANCTTSALQVLQRAKTHEDLLKCIPSQNMLRSTGAIYNNPGSYMLVDFWNSKCIQSMHAFVEKTKEKWDKVIIVIDEVDQAGYQGVKTRMEFVDDIEKLLSSSVELQVILITASVSNLSKCICKLSTTEHFNTGAGIVYDIVHKKSVTHVFAEPHSNYIGPSWFVDNGAWIKLDLPLKSAEPEKDRDNLILENLKNLSISQKELSLIVTSTKTEDHEKLAQDLFEVGYNVVVELNGKNNKNYKVLFWSEADKKVVSWKIPYSTIESAADSKNLEEFHYLHDYIQSGISKKDDLTLAHVLQASLFMKTSHEQRISQHVSSHEWNKLLVISEFITHLDRSKRRPSSYPRNPCVAMIAGHLAGRGITIQNPFIDFVCTSFCFTDSKDTTQRGAPNCQRFGRACGMLKEIYGIRNRVPVLIATPGIIKDSIANEKALYEKMSEEMIALKDFIPREYWNKIVKKTSDDMSRTTAPPLPKISIKTKTKCPLKRNGVVGSVPDTPDTILVTSYVTMSRDAFTSSSLDAHMSMAEISAKTVSDISNIYRNPSWCYKPYHVIIKEEENKVVIIKRNVEIIKNPPRDCKYMIAHNHMGQLQSYIVEK